MYDDDQEDTNVDPTYVDHVVSKAAERRMFQHAEFELVCARFW